MYSIISTGSHGNAIVYHDSIMVDCGVPFAAVKPYLRRLQIILLTHEHKDHLNIETLRKIVFERPGIRIACGDWLKDQINFGNVDVLKFGAVYNYTGFQVSVVKLYHDVPNCGYRIFKDGTKIFHATDTGTLEGITAKNYDLYAIESNYPEDTINAQIERNYYKIGAVNSHLSDQQARNFIDENRGEFSQVLRLHESKQG